MMIPFRSYTTISNSTSAWRIKLLTLASKPIKSAFKSVVKTRSGTAPGQEDISSIKKVRRMIDSIMMASYRSSEQYLQRFKNAQLVFDSLEYPVKGLWTRPKQYPISTAILYFHGGAHAMGNPTTHRPLTSLFAHYAGIPVFSLDYPLAPEAKFPASLEYALAAYRYLTQKLRIKSVVLMGDSSGGNLAFATALALTKDFADADIILPKAVVGISPWLDLSCSSESYTNLADADPILSSEGAKRIGLAYVGWDQSKLLDPLASPYFATEEQFSRLPPCLIHIGDNDILLDDSLKIEEKLPKGSHIYIWRKMPHVFPMLYPWIDEPFKCAELTRDFIARNINPQTTTDQTQER